MPRELIVSFDILGVMLVNRGHGATEREGEVRESSAKDSICW